MKQKRSNTILIFTLSILWGFSLVAAQFIYFMGSTEGFVNALEAMIPYAPVAVAIVLCSWAAGRGLAREQFNINPTKRKFVFIAILCLFFFPVGLFILFRTIKYRELER